jgi:hypothetical protein
MKDMLVLVEKIVTGDEMDYSKPISYIRPITVTFTMSEVLVDDFNSHYPLDTATEFGEALLQEISVLLKK